MVEKDFKGVEYVRFDEDVICTAPMPLIGTVTRFNPTSITQYMFVFWQHHADKRILDYTKDFAQRYFEPITREQYVLYLLAKTGELAK